MITNYLFQNRNEQEVKPMFTVRNMLPLLLVVLLLCGLSFGGTFWTVNSSGGGNYTTIQAALNAAGPNEVTEWPITIEVQDSNTYKENLVFPVDVNGLTLRAGTGFFPTIALLGTGVPADTNFIEIKSVGTSIEGFKINFSATSPYTQTTDNNSTMVKATGGASRLVDCNIIGPSAALNYWIRGIAGVAEINNVELSQCRVGMACDANWFVTGFNYSITNSWIYNNRHWGIVFNDCNAVVDNCLIERSGWPNTVANSNVLTNGSGSALNLLIKNSTIRSMLGTGRNVTMESLGTVTIEDSIIRDAMFDEILQYQGTLNLNRCIIKNTDVTGGCVNVNNDAGSKGNCYTNIDHCSLQGYSGVGMSYQWAVFTVDNNAHVAVTNSILTGHQGFYTALPLNGVGSYFTSNYNDNDCNAPISGDCKTPVVVTNGILPKQNPMYVQTTSDSIGSDANKFSLHTYFALQPYSPVINRDEFGGPLGAKGVVYGHEEWPADIDGVYGVDVNDLKVFSSKWLDDSNIIYPGPNSLLDNFEGYLAFPDPNWSEVTWGGYVYPTPVDPNYLYAGPSTLKLLKVSDGCDVYEGSQAMRWTYDVNYWAGSQWRRFTEILVVLPQTIDINVFPDANGQPGSRFNQLKVMVNRHVGNSPAGETYMYVKFLDKTRYPSTTTHQKQDIVAHMVGGSTDANAGEWIPWTINLANMAEDLAPSITRPCLTRISGIIFGIRDQLEGPWGPGEGIIDMDKIELIDLYGCRTPIVSDLTGDCRVDFRDYVIFANYWLDGK